MKFYLAAAYVARDVIREQVLPQVPAQHECRTSWLEADHPIHAGTIGASTDSDQAYIDKHTMKDFEEVEDAEAVILLTESFMCAELPGMQGYTPSVFTTGGRHIETGFALALGKLVVVVGEPENVFHRGCCQVVSTLSEAFAVLDIAQALRTSAE